MTGVRRSIVARHVANQNGIRQRASSALGFAAVCFFIAACATTGANSEGTSGGPLPIAALASSASSLPEDATTAESSGSTSPPAAPSATNTEPPDVALLAGVTVPDGCPVPSSSREIRKRLMGYARGGGDQAPALMRSLLDHDVKAMRQGFVTEEVLTWSAEAMRQTLEYISSIEVQTGPDATLDKDARCYVWYLNAALLGAMEEMLGDEALMASLPKTRDDHSYEELKDLRFVVFFENLLYPTTDAEFWDGIQQPVTDDTINAYLQNSPGRSGSSLSDLIYAPTFAKLSCTAKMMGYSASCDVANYQPFEGSP